MVRLSASINQASRTPLEIHASILSFAAFSRSLGDITSMTNSGESRRNSRRSAGVRRASDSFETQDASGERAEPSGRTNSTLESKALPRPVLRAQIDD